MFELMTFGSLLAAGLLFATSTTISAQSWTTHQDAAGFSVEIPKGWTVSNELGRVTVTGPNLERVTIQPLRVKGQLDANGAQRLLVGLSNQLWPGQRWNMPQGGWQFGANGVRAFGADDSTLRKTTALWWVKTGQEATGFFYAVAAPPARFKATEPVFARILESFRVTRASGGGGGRPGASDPLAGMQFRRWVDPTENAYSVELPADWRVWGGIKRVNITGRRSEFVAQSPDGQVTIRSGDVNVPDQYIELNQTMVSLGYRDGQMYSGTTMIMQFMPAVVFATNYIQMTAGRSCSNLQWLSQRDRPDFVQSLALQRLLLERNHYTAGEVTYTCQAGGKPYVGYLFVETSAAPDMGVTTTWNLKTLYGFMAPADRATQADVVLQRALASFSINPQWWAAEVGMDARVAEDYRHYREFSAKLQQQTQAARWASWERIAEQRGLLLQNATIVVDPETGQSYKVANTSNYYWIDPINNLIVGTNIPYKPTWDFREMVQKYK